MIVASLLALLLCGCPGEANKAEAKKDAAWTLRKPDIALPGKSWDLFYMPTGDVMPGATLVLDNGTTEAVRVELAPEAKVEVPAGTRKLVGTKAGKLSFKAKGKGLPEETVTQLLESGHTYVFNPGKKHAYLIKEVGYGLAGETTKPPQKIAGESFFDAGKIDRYFQPVTTKTVLVDKNTGGVVRRSLEHAPAGK